MTDSTQTRTTPTGAPVAGGPAAPFVHEWFDRLSAHEPVEQILLLVDENNLEMVFPDRTLHNRDDFLDWYSDVGDAFADQKHTIEKLESQEGPNGIGVWLTVIWEATQTSDGTRLKMRAHQQWRLTRKPADGAPQIARYKVLDLSAV